MPQPYQFRGNAYRKLGELHAWAKQRREPALEPQLQIIDSHHHVLDDERGRYLVDELVEDLDTGHNIIATVGVEVGTMYRSGGAVAERPVGEVEFLNGISAMGESGRYGTTRLCAGIVGHTDLMLGVRAQPVLEALIAAANGRLRGIRHGVIWDTGDAARFGRRKVPPHQLLDFSFQRGFGLLAPLGLTFDAWQFHPQLPDLVELVRAFPDTSVILDHAGGLVGIPPHDKRDEVFDIWRANIRELVQFPNVTVKVGGLGMLYCGWDFHLGGVPPSSEDLAAAWTPYVETCIELFGPTRCMMESNFPTDKQSCGYGVLWNALKRITQAYSPAEKAALYRDTAARVYALSI